MRAYLTLLAVTMCATSVAAHDPPGFTAFAAGIPDEMLEKIQIDGVISDWAWMPDTFIWTMESDWPGNVSDDVRDGSTPRDDFDVFFFVAWSPTTNMMYHVGTVVDDATFDRVPESYESSYAEDNYNWSIDANHGAEPTHPDGQPRFHWQQLVWTPIEKTVISFGAGPGDCQPGSVGEWTCSEPFLFHAGTTIDFDWTFEIAHMIHDFLDVFGGAGESVVHTLTAGEIVGMGLTFEDQDTEAAKSEIAWRTKDLAGSGENLSDLFLVSVEDTRAEITTAVQASSWGRIKATFDQTQ